MLRNDARFPNLAPFVACDTGAMPWTTPDVDTLLKDSFVVSIPLRSRFRNLQQREVMIFRGPQGLGEWAAFTEYSDAEAAVWLQSGLEQAFDSSVPLPKSDGQCIPINAIFPNLSPDAISQWWDLFPSAHSAKVKVGEDPNPKVDIERIKIIRQVIGPETSLRLDANGRWSVAGAHKILEELYPVCIDYVEQPVPTVNEMVELKGLLEGTNIRLAADELVRQSHQLSEVIARSAAEVAVLKVSPLGGIHNTLTLARQAIDAGLEVVISSGLETSVGLSWGARAVALLTEEFGPQPDAGLATAALLASDITREPLTVADGAIRVTTPVLDDEAIHRLAASPERTAWWHERLRRCLPLALERAEII